MRELQLKSPVLQNDSLQTRTISTKVTITGSATPADKTVAQKLPGHIAIASSGQAVTGIDASASGDSVSDTAPCTVAVLLYDLVNSAESIDEVTSIYVEDCQGAATGALTVERLGDSALTASGNIWFQVTAPGLALTTTGDVLELGIEVSYKVRL